MIIEGKAEEALSRLATQYHVSVPRIRVGAVKRHSRDALGVYVRGKEEIVVRRREVFFDPFTILHEWYHHLRSQGGEHRGTERNANRFAIQFIKAYQRIHQHNSESE